MSQPQPSHGFSKPVLVAVIVIVAVVGVIGAMFASGLFQSLLSANNQSQDQLSITGNYITETVPIAKTSIVDVTCNYCNITLQLANSNITMNLNVIGNSNHMVITNGRSNIDITGNFNVIDARQTTVLSTSNTGNGNTIQR